jgi:ATP-dependent Clp protease ATP-binding subunit ClpA
MDASNLLKPMLARGELRRSALPLLMNTVNILKKMQHRKDAFSR